MWPYLGATNIIANVVDRNISYIMSTIDSNLTQASELRNLASIMGKTKFNLYIYKLVLYSLCSGRKVPDDVVAIALGHRHHVTIQVGQAVVLPWHCRHAKLV